MIKIHYVDTNNIKRNNKNLRMYRKNIKKKNRDFTSVQGIKSKKQKTRIMLTFFE